MTSDPISTRSVEPTIIRSTDGMTTKVIKGSMWTFAGQILPLCVSIVTTPFVIRLLGSEGYGIIVFVGLIPVYLTFADFGMSMASTKFASEAFGRGDPLNEGRIIRSAAIVALMASLPISAAIFLFSDALTTAFNIPDHLRSQASLSLKFASITFPINLLSSIFNTAELVRLRMDLNTFANLIFRIPGIILIPFVIFLGGNISDAVLVSLIASSLTLAAHIFISWSLLPPLLGKSIDREAIIPMLRFGGSLAIAGVAVALIGNLEKMLLTPLVSVQSLAYFSVAFTFASMTTTFAASMVQSLIPAFARLLGGGKQDEFRTLFSRGMRINLIWIPPTITILVVLARPFFTVWAGKEFGENSVFPFYILLFGVVVNLMAYLPYCAIVAVGRTDAVAKLYWFEVFAFTGITYILVSNYGTVGAALAWSLRAIFDGFSMMILSKKLAGTTAIIGDNSVRRLAGGLFLLPAIVAATIANEVSFLPILFCAVGLPLYGIWSWKASILREEQVWIRSYLLNALRRFHFS